MHKEQNPFTEKEEKQIRFILERFLKTETNEANNLLYHVAMRIDSGASIVDRDFPTNYVKLDNFCGKLDELVTFLEESLQAVKKYRSNIVTAKTVFKEEANKLLQKGMEAEPYYKNQD